MIRHAGLLARWTSGRWLGALVEAPSGSGKSDLALRSLSQDLRLVADDRVLIWACDGRLWGRAPETLGGLIEVRGLGIERVAALPYCEIGMLVRLAAPDRLPEPDFEIVLGVRLPAMELAPFEASAPAKLGRALVRVDAAGHRRM